MSRFFRFRLRTLLFGMMILGGVGGWLVNHEVEHRREIEVVQEVCGDRKIPSIEFSMIDNDTVYTRVQDAQFFG